MKHGSLFSGIGGFDLAAEWMGWENVFHCEWNPFGQKVLKHYWPKAISYEDITKTDFSIHRGNIDIITGGFPCQPYSSAGKRLGKEDERHLWPQMLRAIREIKPRWVVGENVRGLINWNGGMVFEEVCADLENLGYQVTSFLIPACATNAPHKRERIWFVAYSKTNGLQRPKGTDKWQEYKQNDRYGIRVASNSIGEIRSSSYSNFIPNNDKPNSRSNGEIIEPGRQEDKRIFTGFINGRNSKDNDAADTNNKMLESGYRQGETGGRTNKTFRTESFSKPRDWATFPSVSPVCVRNDGFPDRLDGITFPKWRNESIKAGGNAVVPQVVYQIFKTIEAYEKLNNVNNTVY